MTNKVMGKIAIRNFYGNGKHIYEDQMGSAHCHLR